MREREREGERKCLSHDLVEQTPKNLSAIYNRAGMLQLWEENSETVKIQQQIPKEKLSRI